MIRESLQALLLVCRKIQVAYGAASYELHDYEEGSFADFRVMRIKSVGELADLTKDFQVSVFADEGHTIIRVYENYSEVY